MIRSVPEVTEAMVVAALNAFDAERVKPDHGGTYSQMHAAITAALKAGCTHPRMGNWWPCNFGVDEVRTCRDCDYLEKRVVGVTSAPSEAALVVLCAHQWDHLAQGCTCGWTQKRSLPRDSRQMNHPAHVVDVLRLVGVVA